MKQKMFLFLEKGSPERMSYVSVTSQKDYSGSGISDAEECMSRDR